MISGGAGVDVSQNNSSSTNSSKRYSGSSDLMSLGALDSATAPLLVQTDPSITATTATSTTSKPGSYSWIINSLGLHQKPTFPRQMPSSESSSDLKTEEENGTSEILAIPEPPIYGPRNPEIRADVNDDYVSRMNSYHDTTESAVVSKESTFSSSASVYSHSHGIIN